MANLGSSIVYGLLKVTGYLKAKIIEVEDSIIINGNEVLTTANEGSGNGIDADTVDGEHASAFANASHTHSYLPLVGGTVTGSTRFSNSTNYFGGTTANTAEIWMQTGNAGSPQIALTDNQGDVSWAIGADDADNSFKIHGNASATIPTINNLAVPFLEITTSGIIFNKGTSIKKITSGTANPSGGSSGDVYFQYE